MLGNGMTSCEFQISKTYKIEHADPGRDFDVSGIGDRVWAEYWIPLKARSSIPGLLMRDRYEVDNQELN